MMGREPNGLNHLKTIPILEVSKENQRCDFGQCRLQKMNARLDTWWEFPAFEHLVIYTFASAMNFPMGSADISLTRSTTDVKLIFLAVLQ